MPDISSESANAKPLKILLADDHAVGRLQASRILQKKGHSVVVVDNGRDAVELVSQQAFDLVLMDVEMPIMGGLEAISRIRRAEHETGQHVPIAALTSHAEGSHRQACLDAGADVYLSKPLRSSELDTALQMFADRHAIAATGHAGSPTGYGVSGSNESPAVTGRRDMKLREFPDATARHDHGEVPEVNPLSTALLRHVDLDCLLAGTGSDKQLASQLISIFQNDLPRTIARLQDAISREDLVTVSRIAHSLKTPLRLFGAVHIHAQSHMLERQADYRCIDQLQDTFSVLRSELAELSHSLSTLQLNS